MPAPSTVPVALRVDRYALNASAFDLARGYEAEDMTAYVALQQREFGMEDDGYTATRHQREVGAGYFDDVATAVSGGLASTLALKGSTEQEWPRASRSHHDNAPLTPA